MIDVEFICLAIFGLFFFIAIAIERFLYNKRKYEQSEYFKIAKIPFLQISKDCGHYGEFLIYKELQIFELDGSKFLFNLYIPTDKQKTTEIDVLMISKFGLFVIESKNYSGWIFGTEANAKWTQSLYVGYGKTQKEHFYNPIMQNEYHIKKLKQIINNDLNYYSIVVFSDRCELKKIIRNPNSKSILVYRSELIDTIKHIKLTDNYTLSEHEMNEIYDKLYPYSQADESTKMLHILNLKKNL